MGASRDYLIEQQELEHNDELVVDDFSEIQPLFCWKAEDMLIRTSQIRRLLFEMIEQIGSDYGSTVESLLADVHEKLGQVKGELVDQVAWEGGDPEAADCSGLPNAADDESERVLDKAEADGLMDAAFEPK